MLRKIYKYVKYSPSWLFPIHAVIILQLFSRTVQTCFQKRLIELILEVKYRSVAAFALSVLRRPLMLAQFKL